MKKQTTEKMKKMEDIIIKLEEEKKSMKDMIENKYNDDIKKI